MNFDIELLKTKKETFADGEINVTFEESVRGQQLVIIAQIQMPYENLFELILTLDAARRSAAREIILVIPYLPHSRQERRDDKRAPITARIVADILQNSGADRIISMDIHTSAIEGFYSIPFDKLSPVEVFAEHIKSLNIQNLKFVSPDFGFMKKMEKYTELLDADMAVIDKTRKKANEISKMKLIGDVAGKNVILVDDIIDTATTLCKATELLLENGAESVSVYSTHGVLSYIDEDNNAIKRLMNSKIKNVFISNTFKKNINDNNKIKIIDVSSIFANALVKILKEQETINL